VSRPSFRVKVLQAREEAILAAVKRLLSSKGFDLMTVDEVAAEVGIAKASLYKHFPSKEALAAAAMVQALERTLAVAADLADTAALDALGRLQGLTRWALQTLLAGEMPALPSQNSSLRQALLADPRYGDRLMVLSDQLGSWITQAQAQGTLARRLPPEAVLFTLYARACDPVPLFLKAAGRFSDAEIVDIVLATCFDGLKHDAPPARP